MLTELRNRGVSDILVACVDGLTGFPDAIESVFPKAKIQLCIVHMMCNSLNFVAWKDRKKVAADLKRIYQSTTVDDAEPEREAFCEKWDAKFPSIDNEYLSLIKRILPTLKILLRSLSEVALAAVLPLYKRNE